MKEQIRIREYMDRAKLARVFLYSCLCSQTSGYQDFWMYKPV